MKHQIESVSFSPTIVGQLGDTGVHARNETALAAANGQQLAEDGADLMSGGGVSAGEV